MISRDFSNGLQAIATTIATMRGQNCPINPILPDDPTGSCIYVFTSPDTYDTGSVATRSPGQRDSSRCCVPQVMHQCARPFGWSLIVLALLPPHGLACKRRARRTLRLSAVFAPSAREAMTTPSLSLRFCPVSPTRRRLEVVRYQALPGSDRIRVLFRSEGR